MAKPFDFLAKAKPASLYRLMEKLPFEDAAIVLAGLPQSAAVQVMAYFPDERQADLLPAMRDARRAEPARAEQTASRIRELLRAAKSARETGVVGERVPPPAPPKAKAEDLKRPDGGGPAVPPLRRQAAAYQALPPKTPAPPVSKAGKAPPSRPQRPGADTPRPWIPRAATGSPINGPALAGKPPPVSGDPLSSPLAKAGLLELIGRAQEKLLPKKGAGSGAPEGVSGRAARPAAGSGGKPGPRVGVLPPNSVRVDSTPRIIGPRRKGATEPSAPPAASGSPRRLDGKAVLAAILREAGPSVRGAVRHDDPELFRELRGRMFFFDDLMHTEDGALAQVFTVAPAEESALALKFAAPALRDRVLRVVSPGRAKALQDAPRGRAGLDAIERAQKKVLDVALQLQATGRILIDPRDPDLAGG